MDEELIEVFTKYKINQFNISPYNSNSGENYIWNEKIPSLRLLCNLPSLQAHARPI